LVEDSKTWRVQVQTVHSFCHFASIGVGHVLVPGSLVIQGLKPAYSLLPEKWPQKCCGLKAMATYRLSYLNQWALRWWSTVFSRNWVIVGGWIWVHLSSRCGNPLDWFRSWGMQWSLLGRYLVKVKHVRCWGTRSWSSYWSFVLGLGLKPLLEGKTPSFSSWPWTQLVGWLRKVSKAGVCVCVCLSVCLFVVRRLSEG
jgi:hypothetical protein